MAKVRFEITVDIDPEAWNENFGLDAVTGNFRAEVRGYLESMVLSQLDQIGVLRDEGDTK